MLWLVIYKEPVYSDTSDYDPPQVTILEAATAEAARKRAAILLYPGIREHYPAEWTDKVFSECVERERKRREERLVVTHVNGPFVSL